MTNPYLDPDHTSIPVDPPVIPVVIPDEPVVIAEPLKPGFQPSEIRKTIVTALGIIVAAGGFIAPYVTSLSPEIGNTIGAVVGVATVILNYLTPNVTTSPARALTQSARLKGAELADPGEVPN